MLLLFIGDNNGAPNAAGLDLTLFLELMDELVTNKLMVYSSD